MSYVLKKTQNGVEVTVQADMTEEFLCDITKDTCDANDGKNFEFVAVKEEIVDGFLTDECCEHMEHADKVGKLTERVAHDEHEILWSQHVSHNDEHDTNRKLNSSSENISLFMPKEVKQRSSSIQFLDLIFSIRPFNLHFHCTRVFSLSAVTS